MRAQGAINLYPSLKRLTRIGIGPCGCSRFNLGCVGNYNPTIGGQQQLDTAKTGTGGTALHFNPRTSVAVSTLNWHTIIIMIINSTLGSTESRESALYTVISIH